MRLPLRLRRKMGSRSKFKPIRAIQYWRYLLDVYLENIYIKHSALPISGVNRSQRNEVITVSLTSYPARMEQTFYAIKSLMLQSLKADKIILWLSEIQFPDHEIPDKFHELLDKGLDVRFTSDDLRSHKKYFYALQEQKQNEVVITYDDDIIYDAKSIERVYNTHLLYPDAVVCDYGLEFSLTDGQISPYMSWNCKSDKGCHKPSLFITPYTGAGCLYPYGIMPPTTFDKLKIRELAFSTDDIWMSLNEVIGNVGVVKTRRQGEMLCIVKGSQQESLGVLNSQTGGDDKTVEKMCRVYPEILSNLTQAIK